LKDLGEINLHSDLSIIIPNWNGFPFIKDCIESIKSSDYDGQIEIILVDNGSDDGSCSWIEETFPDIKILRNKENLGFATACNRGAIASTYDKIVFLNTDMKIGADFLKVIVKALDKNENAASVSAKILDWDGKKTQFAGGMVNFYGHGFQIEQPLKDDSSEDSREILFSCGGAALFKKDTFFEAGGFDEDYFAYFEDVDLGIRLNLMGYKIIYEPDAIAYHIGEASSKNLASRLKHKLYERNALYTIIKNYSDASLVRVLPASLFLAMARTSTFIKTSNMDNSSISNQGIAIIESVNEVINNIDQLVEKRKIVQKMRKISDEKIFEKFGCFLKTNLYDGKYYEKLLKLTENFGIDKLFPTGFGKDEFHAILDDFRALLTLTSDRNESLNIAIANKDIYITRMTDNIRGLEERCKTIDRIDEQIKKQNEIHEELREYIREKDRQIKKLLDEINTKEQFLRLKEEFVKEKEKEIEILNNHILTQDKAQKEFEKRQLDILMNLRNRLQQH
jgi:GT2 family glycosyltransferase